MSSWLRLPPPPSPATPCRSSKRSRRKASFCQLEENSAARASRRRSRECTRDRMRCSAWRGGWEKPQSEGPEERKGKGEDPRRAPMQTHEGLPLSGQSLCAVGGRVIQQVNVVTVSPGYWDTQWLEGSNTQKGMRVGQGREDTVPSQKGVQMEGQSKKRTGRNRRMAPGGWGTFGLRPVPLPSGGTHVWESVGPGGSAADFQQLPLLPSVTRAR